MELRLLRYFLAVAEQESITGASNVLHVTQPTLSRQMADLEAEVGTALFHRGTRRITLTQEGVLLTRRAREILSLVDKTARELAETKDLLAGHITIGCGEMESVKQLTALIASFSEKYPQVSFEVYTADADTVRERIDQGLADIGLLLEPVDMEKYAYVRMKVRERWVAMLPAGSPLARKETLTAAELFREKLMFPRRDKVRAELANWFGRRWKHLHSGFSFNLSTNAALMVRQGLGIALVLEGSMPFAGGTEIVLRPLSPELTATTVLAWKRDQPFGRAVTRFIEYIQAKEEQENNQAL